MPDVLKSIDLDAILSEWLVSCTRNKKISRNTVAVAVVILGRIKDRGVLSRAEIVSAGGEISGARAGLPKLLASHGIPEKYLKEVTTRQAHQDGQRLLDQLGYGNALSKLGAEEMARQLDFALKKLRTIALEWLGRRHILLSCNRQNSPAVWIAGILSEAKGKSGGKVEQHLVGAKLERRHLSLTIPNFPGHAGDVQTGRFGDYIVGTTCYHVTTAPASSVIMKCKENVCAGLHPVLLVPRETVAKCRHLAEDAGAANEITVIAIEDFVATNIIELSEGKQSKFFETLNEMVTVYNRRLEEVETDMSLQIELR